MPPGAVPVPPARRVASLQLRAAACVRRFAELLQQEMQLLSELTVSNSLSCCSVDEGAAALPDPEPEAISPEDPMHYFRTVSTAAPESCCLPPATTMPWGVATSSSGSSSGLPPSNSLADVSR